MNTYSCLYFCKVHISNYSNVEIITPAIRKIHDRQRSGCSRIADVNVLDSRNVEPSFDILRFLVNRRGPITKQIDKNISLILTNEIEIKSYKYSP